ncbi:hypothetical protein BLOT_008459 [Blomia tropicalis]|nr:hypothetical protein BLOT_008459 [Blomia tropicalis]
MSQGTQPVILIVNPRPMDKDESIDDYVSYFRRVIKANNWSDTQAMLVFGALTHAQVSILPDIDTITSFKEVEKRVKRRKELTRDHVLEKWHSIKRKPGQDLVKLSNDIVKLTNDLYPNIDKTLILRDRFLLALDYDLRKLLTPTQSSLKTMQEVLDLALTLDVIKVTDKSTSKSKKWCSQCKKSNHNTVDCRKKDSSQVTSQSSVSNSFKNSQKTQKPKNASIQGDCSSDRQFLKAKVDGQWTHLLVDNGSSFSLVPKSFEIMYPLSSLQARAANGSNIDIVGYSRFLLDLDNHKVEQLFYVADVDVPIIGRDFLKKIKAVIHYNNVLDYVINDVSLSSRLYLESENSFIRFLMVLAQQV